LGALNCIHIPECNITCNIHLTCPSKDEKYTGHCNTENDDKDEDRNNEEVYDDDMDKEHSDNPDVDGNVEEDVDGNDEMKSWRHAFSAGEK